MKTRTPYDIILIGQGKKTALSYELAATRLIRASKNAVTANDAIKRWAPSLKKHG